MSTAETTGGGAPLPQVPRPPPPSYIRRPPLNRGASPAPVEGQPRTSMNVDFSSSGGQKSPRDKRGYRLSVKAVGPVARSSGPEIITYKDIPDPDESSALCCRNSRLMRCHLHDLSPLALRPPL